MYRKWKSVAALGMAVLIGCSMPMGTMLAAEVNPEAVQEVEVDSASDTGAAYDEETVLDNNGNDGDEIDADDEKDGDEVNVEEDEDIVDETDADDVIADEEVVADNDGNDGIAVMSETDGPEAGDVAVQSAAPVIDIKWNNEESSKYGLGGQIDFKYVNNNGQAFVCSASQDGQAVSLFYCLEKVTTTSNAKGEEQMASLSWKEASSSSERIPLSDDAKYVLYVKAVGADGQITYARSGGVVVDTIAPDVSINLVNGGTYPEGTEFQVSDANLESVKVNEVDVTSGWDAVYQVTANGTSSSCVIRLKDKAGNEKVYSVNVSRDTAEDGVISENGIYSLQADTPYILGEGKWQVNNDKSVYAGGNTFYVGTDGNYRFTKC